MALLMLCPKCNEDAVLRDAFASWNVETQKWEVSSVYDDFCCDNCGAKDITPLEVPYDCMGKPSSE